jgi:type I restriction enzyme, S subunit
MTMSLVVEHFDDLLATPEDVAQLNRVILQLAIQGKLVAQNSNDEPASSLIKRIHTKKESLIEDGTIAKDAKLSPVKYEEQIFDLPSGWIWTRLGTITKDITRYPTFYGMEHLTEGVPVIRGEHINLDGSISHDWNDYWYVTKEISAQFPRTVTEKNDLIMMVRGSIGKLGFVDEQLVGAQVSPNCIRISYFDTECFPKYLFYFLRSSMGKTAIQENVRSTAIATIKASDFETTVVPLPPYAEQQRIVARVEELFAQTRALAKELEHSKIELDGLNKSALSHLLASETSEEFNQHWDFIAEHFDLLFQAPEHVAPLRQSILELAVRGKLTRREAGDESAKELLKRIREEKARNKKKENVVPIKESEKLYGLPNGWEWTRLVSIADIGTGSTPSRSNPDYYFKGTIPWATSSVTNNPIVLKTDELITEEAVRDTRLRIYPKHTLLVALYGQGKTRGQVSELLIDSTINQACASLMFNGQAENLRAYVKLFLLKNYREIRLLAEGGAQPNLNLDKIKQTVLPLPPLAEQERIVKRVGQLLSLCDALEARLQSAEEERGRLVGAVMAGVGKMVENRIF